MTEAEVEHGFLNVSPDLEPVSILTEDETYQRLVDGTELVEALAGFDNDLFVERDIPLQSVGDSAWVLAPNTLGRLGLAAGDLVAVTVRPEGFELDTVPDIDPARDLAGRLSEALHVLGDGEPDQLDSVVWLACADDPSLFSSPQASLAEVLDSQGLVWDIDKIAPPGFDFAGWRMSKRLAHLAETHRLDDDDALAVLVLTRVYDQVREVFEHAQKVIDAGEPRERLVSGSVDADRTIDELPSESVPDSGMDVRLVRDVVHHLADPAVAEALLVETIGAGREGAAALGMFAETLGQQAPRSARPALHWLHGKALDRLGNVLEAEQAYQAALGLVPSHPLPLFELARIASERGDAERGLSLLRRADTRPDDELVVLLDHFRPVERSNMGRNDPCWCGSGRKYKVCHRNREILPLDERAAWLYQKAGSYLSEGPWRSRTIDLARIRARHWDSPDATWTAIQDPLVNDVALFEGGVFAAFLDERGVLLPDDEQLLAGQWLLAERSIHEVETVSPGNGFTALDLRTGEQLEVRERTASRALKKGALICARLVPAGGIVQCFGGIEPVALHERDELLALLDGEPEAEDLIAILSRRFAPPTLQNTESEPLVLCEAILRTVDPSALTVALDTAYDRDEGESRWFEHVTTHGTQRVRASLTLDSADLHVETNSETRLDRVLDTLQQLQPGIQILDQKRRPASDVQEAMSRAPSGAADIPNTTLDPNDPLMAAVLEQMIRTHEQAWLDESIRALAGATPREAADDPTRRPDLIALLNSFGPARSGSMHPDRLRAALGL